MTRTLVRFFKQAEVWCAVMALFPLMTQAADFEPERYAVQVSATVQETPAKITLKWPGDPAISYQVSKRTLNSGWQVLANYGSTATTFEDSNVQVGIPYEYRLVKDMGNTNIGYAYIQAAIKKPLVDSHGKVILVVEQTVWNSLATEIRQLETDLQGDGWGVTRVTVSKSDSPVSVKTQIRNAYNTDPANYKAVFLLGHVPVPYSGQIFPDGHENHEGAWPADVYYGEMTSQWTDSTVNYKVAEREVNWNVPGDGKFDQSKIPSEVEMAVGRVDFFEMTNFSNKNPSRSETDLTRAYLLKNNAWRHGRMQVPRRGLICDNFSDKGEDPIAGSAWRNFPTFFGATNIHEVGWDQYLPEATQNSYLWSYASGGGSYYYSMGVAGADDFALQNLKVIFTMFMGSYFGDWNNESNFLRASLGSGSVLTATYSGFPQYQYFPMALGGTIGDSVKLSQNNFTNTLYAPWVQGWSEVHMALLGDPTLRMHPVLPPSNLNVSVEPGRANLAWGASGDTNLVGYHVYRGNGTFTRVTAAPITGTSFSESVAGGTYTYMVRAIKLEQSGSGSYFNPSQGIMAVSTVPPGSGTPPPVPGEFNASLAGNSVTLTWSIATGAEGYKIEQSVAGGSWAEIANVGFRVTTTTLNNLDSGKTYAYRIRAFNSAGNSGYTEVKSVTTAPSLPGVPTNLRATTVTHNSIVLSWDATSTATGYDVGYRPAAQATPTYANLGAVTSWTMSNVTPQTEYVFQIRSKNAAGNSAYSSELRVTTPAAPVPSASVSYLATKSDGGGTWTTTFGSEGFWVAGGVQALPPYATVTPPGAPHIWASTTSDTRAPVISDTNSQRAAAAWHGSEVIMPVMINGATSREVTFYFVDWDRAGRRTLVQILDAGTGTILDSRSIDNFGNGVYLSYRIKGSVKLRLIAEAGPNAVISAVLFGTKTSPINDPVNLMLRHGTVGKVDLVVNGSPGQKFAIEKTTDFINWTEVTTGQLSSNSTTISLDWTGANGLVSFRSKNQ